MNLIIIGASARAAAFSAHRAGMRPWCVDLFADTDLAARFPVRRLPIADYPGGLLAALRDAPDGPVLYTGGLENYPDLLGRIDRPVWGNPPKVLRRVRDPFLVADLLRRHGLPTFDVRDRPPAADDRRQWLLKARRSSGGLGVRLYVGQPFDPRTHYLQQRATDDGALRSAAFLGLPDGHALLLGVTAMLDVPWLHAPRFHYRGNLGPLNVATALLEQVGTLLASEFGLSGLFGIDTMFADHDGNGIWSHRLLEVNPRYTASMEILERALGTAFLDLHRAVFEQRAVTWNAPTATRCWGKAVLFARAEVPFPHDGPWRNALHLNGDAAPFADIPAAGEVIARGQPVMTFFAPAATAAACHVNLCRQALALDRCLWGS